MKKETKFLDHSKEMKYANRFLYPIASRLCVSVEGFQNIPKKGYVVLFTNHGGWGAFDWFLFHPIFWYRLKEFTTGFTLPFVFKIPGLGHYLRFFGELSTDQIEDIEFLKSYSRIFAMAPEGAYGNAKPFTESYQLRPFRPGFIKLALKLKAKLVPVTSVGSEDIFPVLFETSRFHGFIGSNFGIPFSLFPLPLSRIKAKIYPPIDLSGYDPSLADDHLFCVKLAEKLRHEHQERINNDAMSQPFFKINKFIGNFFGNNPYANPIRSITDSKARLRKGRESLRRIARKAFL